MGNIKVGDIVARKSHGMDILFKVVDIKRTGSEDVVTLKGICYRIEADAPESDLVVQSDQRVDDYNSKLRGVVEKKLREVNTSKHKGGIKKALYRSTSKGGSEKFSKPGKILHIDGDNDYLDTCLREYRKLGLTVIGKHVPEKEQALHIGKLLREYSPDILVLTGHDGVTKGEDSYGNLDSYRNSKFYIEAVKEARKYQPDLDSLVIFAGACQSMYNELLKAGANYASSPFRVLIHALDPVLVCEKVAYTNIDTVLAPATVINNTITGAEGIGGIQTRGKFREGFPQEPYSS